MHRLIIVLIVLLAVAAGFVAGYFTGQHVHLPGSSADAPSGNPANLKWARQIAESFLQTVVDADTGAALDLGSPTFRQHYGLSTTENADAKYNARMALYKSFGYDSQLPYKDDPARHDKFHIEKEEMAPGHPEAIFVGTLSGPKRTNPFRLIVTRDQHEKWRVEVFQLSPGN